MRRAFGALLIALVMAGCGDPGPPAGGGGNVTTDVPPPSKVWFGSAFDPASFALTAKATAAKQGTPVVAVGRLLTAREPDGVSVQISTGGSVRLKLAVAAGATGPTDLYGVDLTSSNLGPATYIVSFVDARGSVLASGNLNITP